MSKRLAYLEKLTQDGSTDPFAWYGLALEYKTLDRVDDALRTFEKLCAMQPDYVPMYLMAGQTLIDKERWMDARMWLDRGVLAAKAKGDSHALGEIEAALDQVMQALGVTS